MQNPTPCRPSRGVFVAGLLAIVVGVIAPVYADATYFDLSTGDLAQDWSNTGLITANDNWSGVPSIIGYLGQGITTTTGTDPQTLTATSANANDVDVIANQTHPGITSGGVAEFELPNPTVALQGSATANAPYLQLHLNTTGRTNIVVSYTLRDIDGTADNAVQPVALQYRVGTSGSFINLPAGFVADASTGPSLATLTTNVSVTLPAAAENQPQVQVRVITANAVGNDEWIGIDNILVTSSSGGAVTPAGQISHTGGVYSQNFDTLPSSGVFTLASRGPFSFTTDPINAAGMGGWSFAKYDGGTLPTAVALFKVDAGASTSGSVYSYGTGTAAERALGLVASGSTISRFGVSFVNNTGRTITQFTLGYTGEQWRRGTGAANKLAFAYSLGGTDINTGTFTAASSLDFTAPVTAGSGVALDGNAADNRIAISGTVSGLNWTPNQTLILRWSDVDNTGDDDGLAIDDLTFDTFVRPFVTSATPRNGTPGVAKTAPVALTFSEPVNVSGSWFTLIGSKSGAHTATVTGGPTGYTLTPDVPFDEETVTLTVLAAQVTGQAPGAFHPSANFTSSFSTVPVPQVALHTVQGGALTSTFAGQPVIVQGVVVASFQGAGKIGGYYIEAPDADQDADPATSEGVYVFDNANSVTLGDFVTVTGTVTEFGSAPNSQTEISPVFTFTKASSGNPLPTAKAVSLPFASTGFAERYEGMRVTFSQALTVTDNFDYGHFGELMLSNGRLSTPTNIVAPGAAAQAQEAANLLNQIMLDDGSSRLYPDPTPFLSSADPTTATRRAGSTTTGLTGILDNRFGTYVIEPTTAPLFVDANPRGAAPAPAGRLHVAIGNVLNFFNGNGTGLDGAAGGFPTTRGATSLTEYQRQRAKMIAGIAAIAPDIMGLTEVENDHVADGSATSYGPTSAIADIVNGLNAVAPAGTTYAYVDAAAVEITTDVIHVALIYRTETVETVGDPKMLNDAAFNNLARNPLAQTFREKSTGAKLTVCINHFRAKGSAASGVGNANSGDGQGTNNALRVQEANAVTAWLATDPTGSGDPDFLIIGDLNAYAKEDPIVAIENAGYTNLTEQFEGVGGYSYSFNGEFGHLDHSLANAALVTQVVGAATWHVNSDEPVYYDYNTENKDPAQQAINVGTPYRYSDHDPVVIGVNLISHGQHRE